MPKRSGDSPVERRALVLAPEAPYPVAGGGPIRTASLIEYLRQRYTVEVITFREPGAPDPKPHFPAGVAVHVIDLPFHSKTAFARAMRNLGRAVRGAPPLMDRFAGFDRRMREALGGRRFALGVVEHFWCAPYAEVLRPCCERLLMNLHNVESVLLERTAGVCTGPASAVLRHFARRSRVLEAEWLPQFDTVLVTSDRDASEIRVPSIVYPNAIPWVPEPVAVKRHEIMFSGNLEYEPNKAAVQWFHDRVWPILRAERPGVVWKLVGKNEQAMRERLHGDDRIVLTGPVPDAIEALAQGRVAVVPVISGSGTRLKIVEAWAAGLPVVSTTIGAEGLPYTEREHLYLADEPAKFAAAVSGLLGDIDAQVRLGRSGRRLYEERLTWEAVWRTLEDAGL